MNHLEFHNCKIVNIVNHTETIKSFFIEYNQPIEYLSGQFIIIQFEHLDHQFNTRSYSIANFNQENILELCIVIKQEGAATPQLFDLKIGDYLNCSLPQGRFVLPETIEEQITLGFICTGTGVAPFRAMILDLLHSRKCSNPMHLFFGCRTKEDILYMSEFEELAIKFPNFKYYPVLSRDKNYIRTGYIHEHYPEIFESKPEALIYLCGWTEMVKEAREKLKSYGYTRQQIKIEFYD